MDTEAGKSVIGIRSGADETARLNITADEILEFFVAFARVVEAFGWKLGVPFILSERLFAQHARQVARLFAIED